MELSQISHRNNISCVGTICNVDKIPNIDTVKSSCQIVEIRLDQLHTHSQNHNLFAILKSFHEIIPIILTARHPSEGGHHHLTIGQRSALIADYLEYASYVDIELDFWEENLPIVDLARSAGVSIIGSTHDFTGPPDLKKLARTVALGKTHEVDITKIAVCLHQVSDLVQLCDFMKNHKGRSLSVMGMGKLGPVSRLLFAQHRSVLNYGFLEEANAPGQLPVRIMNEMFDYLEVLPCDGPGLA